MKKLLGQAAVCVTIAGLFVLVVFLHRQLNLLGPETTGVALVTAAVLPPGPAHLGVEIGPIRPPKPIDIPLQAGIGPIRPPKPIDIPARGGRQ